MAPPCPDQELHARAKRERAQQADSVVGLSACIEEERGMERWLHTKLVAELLFRTDLEQGDQNHEAEDITVETRDGT